MKICMGKEKGIIMVAIMKTMIVTDIWGWKDPSMEKNRPERDTET